MKDWMPNIKHQLLHANRCSERVASSSSRE
jgi:hypothetical protein